MRGECEDTRSSFDGLTQAFAPAVLIIYPILATQFRPSVQPLVIPAGDGRIERIASAPA